MAANLVTLVEAKAHLRVTSESEDDYIEGLILAAQDHIANFLNDDDYPEAYPLKQAALLLIADYYSHREAQIVGTIVAENIAVNNLLWPYRKGLGI